MHRAVGQRGQATDVLLHERCGLAAARRFFTRRCSPGRSRPRSPRTARACPRVLEVIPSASHTVERYANNPAGTDHGRLKARLWPMRGLKRRRSVQILAGHAFVDDLRRGHYELAADFAGRRRIRAAFDQLAATI